MQNIPIFTAANGLATLILREIPFSGRAYVMFRSVWKDPAALAAECASFCRMAGAGEVYVSHDCKELPLAHAYDMVELRCEKEALPALTDPVELLPLTAERAEEWLEVYNRSFAPIPGAAAYDRREMTRLMKDKTAFWVERDGSCAAIVEEKPDGLAAIAVLPRYRGLGTATALTALHRAQAQVLTVRTASTNERALAMYDRLGFQTKEIVSRWWLAET